MDFCNTLSRGPGKGPRDRIGTIEMMMDWVGRAGWSAPLAPGEAELDAFLELRAALFGVFDRVSDGEAPDPRYLQILNREIAAAGANEHLSADGRGGWRLKDRSSDPYQRLRHAIARDAASLLTGDPRRVKRCPAHECLWLFHDSSKNLSRRWCAMDDCGSRAKMRRHRARPHA